MLKYKVETEKNGPIPMQLVISKKGEKSTFFWFQQKQKQGRIEKGIQATPIACIPQKSLESEVNLMLQTIQSYVSMMESLTVIVFYSLSINILLKKKHEVL